MSKLETIDKQLRHYIRTSEMSQRDIANASDVPESSLSLFMSGSRGLELARVVSICKTLNLQLVQIEWKR